MSTKAAPAPLVPILVTGSSGFIGGALSQLLGADPRFQVTALGRRALPRTPLPAPVRYLSQDFAQPFTLPAAPSIVLHAAGLASDKASPADLYRDNEQAGLHLLQAVRHSCTHFIFISSASVYPAQAAGVLTEDQAGQGELSPYGRSKYDTEAILTEAALQAGIPLTILRPRAVYGPNDRHLLPRLRRLVWGRYLFLPGGMDFDTSLTSIQTLGQAVRAVLAAPPPALRPQILNVADPQPHHLASTVRQALEAELHRTLVPVSIPLRPLRWLASLAPQGPITHQALDYLSRPCLLDTARLRSLLPASDSFPA